MMSRASIGRARPVSEARLSDGGARPGITVLAHVLFALGLVGVVLIVVLVAPHDRPLATYRSPSILGVLLAVVVGWILAWKRPRIPIGWLMLATALLYGLQGPAVAIGLATRVAHPEIAGWASEFGPESDWSWVFLNLIPLALIPLRFPTGRLPSPRWRWFWWLSIALMVVAAVLSDVTERVVEFGVPSPTYLAWTATGPANTAINAVIDVSVLVVMVGAVVSVVVRYRRGDSVERAQLRWLFWAVSITIATLLLSGLWDLILGADAATPGWRGVGARTLEFVGNLCYSLISIAIMIAVLRSGLYAIDRIISRTAAYAVVTLSIVVVYAVIVVLGSLLFPDLPSIGVAAATLAAAALFLPLLRSVRRWVDRRFNRAQYDAEEVVDAFGERVRTGADPHGASEDLVAAVERALQPAAIGMWHAAAAAQEEAR